MVLFLNKFLRFRIMSLWKELPTEIIHKIIQLTGKVVFRDGRYIDINKLKGDYGIIEDIYKKQLKFDITK